MSPRSTPPDGPPSDRELLVLLRPVLGTLSAAAAPVPVHSIMRLHNHVVLVVPIVMQEKLDRMGCRQLVLVCDPPSTDIATMLTIIQQLNALPNAPLIHGFTVDQIAPPSLRATENVRTVDLPPKPPAPLPQPPPPPPPPAPPVCDEAGWLHDIDMDGADIGPQPHGPSLSTQCLNAKQ